MSGTQTAIRGLALGVIVAACAVGCSAAGLSAAPGSPQKQTAAGVKVQSRATAPATAVPTGTASDARGITAHGAKVKARTAVPRGNEMVAVGDSVMLSVAVSLQQEFPGIHVNAVVSRHTDEGLSTLRGLAANGKLRPVVIVGLGTNGGMTTQQVQQLMAIVGAKRTVILVNTLVSLPYEQGTNNALADAAHRYPNVVLANWNKAISGHVSMLRPDGIHPLPSGAKVYVAMIKSAVAQAAQPRDASS